MIKLTELVKYRELLNELEGASDILPNITVEIPSDTVIKEIHHNGDGTRFMKYQFPLADIEKINRRLYDKVRYKKQKDGTLSSAD